MQDQDKTKEQLIAELEKLRNHISRLDQEESRRNRALRLLSELPGMLNEQPLYIGNWAWNWKKDEFVLGWPLRQGIQAIWETGRPEVDGSNPEEVVASYFLFTGKREEIVHPDDLDALLRDFDLIRAGTKKFPVFHCRTKRTIKHLRRIVGKHCVRHNRGVFGVYTDPTLFRALLERLKKAAELSQPFKEGRLQDFFLPKDGDPRELVIAVMWDILTNEILREFPQAIEVINNIVLPYYGEMRSDLNKMNEWWNSASGNLRFLTTAVCHFQGAVFCDSGGGECLISQALAGLLGFPESGGTYNKSDLPWWKEDFQEGFEEILLDQFGVPVLGKVIETNTGKRTVELMVLRRAEESAEGYRPSEWGLACDPRDIEKRAQSEGRPIKYESATMRTALKKADQAAKTDCIVLLTGESGSGKDHLSQYIHNHSKRANMPYEVINCAAIPSELAESELFGHEKGAFTGAENPRKGRFELAEGGTILLNEIGDMQLKLQAKLLTFLDTQKFYRVGGQKEIKANVRLIAATNKDLETEVQVGKFRQDLYYRINGFQIVIPPLRKRPKDIRVLAQEMLQQLQRDMGLTFQPYLDDSELEKMEHYPWPGNVRELQNALASGVMLLDETGRRIKLPIPDFRGKNPSAERRDFTVQFPPKKKYEDLIRDIKQFLGEEALRQTEGNVSAAARLLGVSRDFFYDLPNPPARRKRRTK